MSDISHSLGNRRKHAPQRDVTGVTTRQGSVVSNFPVDKKLPGRRMRTAENKALRPMGIIKNHDDLHIKQDDLLWIFRSSLAVNNNTTTRIRAPHAFASTTGQRTDPDRYPEQEDFEAQLFLMGRAEDNWQYGNLAQPTGYIAIQVSGSMTVSNNGYDDFQPGDFVQWRAHSIHPEKREYELNQISKTIGTPKSKYGPILERVKYSDIFKLPSLALAKYFREHRQNRETYFRLQYSQVLGDVSMDSKDQLFHSAMHADAVMGTYLAVMTLMNYGVVFAIPDDMSKTQDSEIDQIPKGFYDPQDGWNWAEGENEVALQRNANAANLKELAELLGLSSSTSSKYSPAIVEAIIMRQNVGLLDRSSTGRYQKKYMVSAAPGLEGSRFAEGSRGTRNLDKMQLNYSRDKYGSFGDAYRHATHKLIGTALKASEAGTNIDICM